MNKLVIMAAIICITGTVAFSQTDSAISVSGIPAATNGNTTDTVSPAVSEAGSSTCNPPCRTGYICIDGKCVEKCNPPCPAGEQCDGAGNCVAKVRKVVTNSNESPTSGQKTDNNAEDIAIPAREKYRSSLSCALAWNGLVGTGILYTLRPSPSLSFDGGIGISTMGLKYGAQTRICFSGQSTAAGYVGLGIDAISGADDVPLDVSGTSIEFDLKPITFVQLSTGLDIVTKGGLFILLGTGWAFAMNEGVQNVTYDGLTEAEYLRDTYYSYSDNQDVVDAFDAACELLYHGGLVIEIRLGFSF